MFGLQLARDPLKHLAGARRGAALRCVTAPLWLPAELPLPLLEARGWVCPHYTYDTIRSNTLHPGSANQTVGICAAALPERRIPSPLLCPALPCLACHCCVFFCRSAPACCDRPPASAATPRPSTPIAAVQCGPPAAQSRQNSSTHRIAYYSPRPTDRPTPWPARSRRA